MDTYYIHDTDKFRSKEFYSQASSAQELTLLFPFKLLGSTQSPWGVTQDYLRISYCCETIAPFIEIIACELLLDIKEYYPIANLFKIKAKAKNSDQLQSHLIRFSLHYNDEDPKDLDLDDKFLHDVSEYEMSLASKKFYFPELVNDYWANMIHGAYYEIATEYRLEKTEWEYFRKIYRKYPTQRFGFWKAAQKKDNPQNAYVSLESWIIPSTTDLSIVLKQYFALQTELIFLEAEIVLYNDAQILITDSTAVFFNDTEALSKSIECIEIGLVQGKGDNEVVKKNAKIEYDLFGEQYVFKPGRKKYAFHFDYKLVTYNLSRNGDFLIANYKGYSIVLYKIKALSFEESKELCLSPLKDWTKLIIQFSHSKFRNNGKTKTTIYSGGEA